MIHKRKEVIYLEFINFKELHSYTGVYKIECRVNGFCYIGATTSASFAKRYTSHKNLIKNGKIKSKMVNDVLEYGIDSFFFEVLFISTDKEEIAQKEREYIAFYKKNNKSYNVKPGGDFCFISEETYNKMSNANKRTSKRYISKEAREKISRTLSSDHCSLAILNEQKVKDIKTKLISGFSVEELSLEYNVSKEYITNIQLGYRWKYVDVEGWNSYLESRKHPHKITEEQEKEIIEMLKSGIVKNKICKKFKISYDKINKIIEKYNI